MRAAWDGSGGAVASAPLALAGTACAAAGRDSGGQPTVTRRIQERKVGYATVRVRGLRVSKVHVMRCVRIVFKSQQLPAGHNEKCSSRTILLDCRTGAQQNDQSTMCHRDERLDVGKRVL